jgi:uroporphyrinogen decarboxylase
MVELPLTAIYRKQMIEEGDASMSHEEIMNDLRRCINLEIPKRVLCFPLGLEFDVGDAGFTHQQFRNDPDIMVQVGVQTVKKYGYDWYLLHPDDLIEYEATGIAIKYNENIPPAVSNYLSANESTLHSLKVPYNLTKRGRMALYLEGLRGLKREFGNEVCLTGRIAAPFSSAALILGIEPALMLMLENPTLLKRYMDLLVEYNDVVAQAQLEAGADALWLGDCVATSNFISPEQYEEFAAEYADSSCRRIQKSGGIVFYHGSEKSVSHLTVMSELSFDAVNTGEGIDIGYVKNAIGSKKCIMGNLDTINVLSMKSPEEIEKDTKDIVEKGKVNGGYVFCTGEGIPRQTPGQNVSAMISAVRKYGRY